MRCLTLAKQFQQYDTSIHFFCRKSQTDSNYLVTDSGFELIELPALNIDEECLFLVSILDSHGTDLLVIDHYDYLVKHETLLRKSQPVLCFDDTVISHNCDFLINQHFFCKASLFDDKLPSGCKVFCGPQYALIRDDFRESKLRVVNNTAKDVTIFVSLGATDNLNLLPKVIQVIEETFVDERPQIQIATSSSNAELVSLEFLIEQSTLDITLSIDSPRIGDMMKNSNLAVIAGGSLTLETFYMEVPSIVIQTAQNQSKIVAFLEQKGLALTIDGQAKNFSYNLKEHLRKFFDPSVRKQFQKKLNQLFHEHSQVGDLIVEELGIQV